ncbi:MAG TPA: MATE family efflux transporter [Candidatus Ornithomonoglobus merdipullorum]|uniref:Probable multidrug resistance protein NorM n=1 Tax=Candidatus Ornithomonoglobus merdipullorum TaxID=2840895 RepID=A0A9D1MC19_9FIRM|nr:MATE family efflux transporter [Candidatus Ornithomonoglobus merdipullorum]
MKKVKHNTNTVPSGYLFSNTDIRKLIFPLIIEQILTVFVGMVDSMMVSSCGEAAVSGVSLVDTVNVLIVNIFTALATGGAVVCGQFLGMKNEHEAKKSANQLMLFTTFLAVIVMAVLYLLRGFILGTVFGSIDENVEGFANTYFLIVSAAVPFIGIYNAAAALFRAQGNSKVSMYISLLMNAVNICGNAILIYGFDMGVAGAAIPTLVSRILAAVIMLKMISNQKLQLCISKPFSLKPDFGMIRRILRIGVPNALENSMFQLGKILTVSIVTTFGTTHITANAVCNVIAQFQIIPGMAIGQGILTIVSQCVGANDYREAHYYVKKLLKILYGAAAVFSLIINLLMPVIIRGYNLSPETSRLTYEIIWYHTVCVCTYWAFSFAVPNALRAANDVMFPMLVSAFSMWIFRVGASFVIARWLGLGAMGVWIAMTIDWAVRGVFFTIRYRRTIVGRSKSPLPSPVRAEP